MITNFEKLTEDLNEEELKLIRVLIIGYSSHDSSSPIKEPEIVSKLRAKGYKISGVRLRKLNNLIRSRGLLPLIGTSNGYYVSYDPVEIKKQILSLQERSDAILSAAKGLEKFLWNLNL